MDEDCLCVTNKELFYSAMMLNIDRLIGIEYDFPVNRAMRDVESDEAKKTLHKKRLLKINSKGTIKLAERLSECVIFCSQPENCAVVNEENFSAVIYSRGDAHMLLEHIDEGANEIRMYPNQESVASYIAQRLEGLARGDGTNGAGRPAKHTQ